MNGSRSNPPHAGQSHAGQSHAGHSQGGRASSLDALNRTIEGLEARIEGLMETAVREGRTRPQSDPRDNVARPDPVSEIMQRQRALSAGRDRESLRERVSPRQTQRDDYAQAPSRTYERAAEPAPVRAPVRQAVFSADAYAHEPRAPQPFRQEQASREPLRREPLRPQPRPEQTRPDYLRPDPARGAQTRAEPARVAAPQRPDPAMAEIAQALVGLRQELKKDIADGLAREMTTLRGEIRGITVDAAQDQALAEDMRGDLQKLAESISQLGRQASPSQTDALRTEFDELRALIDGLAREDSVRRMEDRWTGVEDRLNIFDNSRDDELVALAYRLDEIKTHIGTLNSTPALHAVEDKLISVAQAIEALGRHVQPDDRRMASQFADLDARLDEISHAIIASGRTASQADTSGVSRVENRLADLSRQIDGLMRPAPDNGLAARIETLTARVEELASEEAAMRLEERLAQLSTMMERSQKAAVQPDLTGYLNDISRKIDALDQGAVNDALAERLDDLARRIDALDMPADTYAGDERFARLEGQLSDIAHRLEESHAAPYDDSDMLRSLQAQIANLSSLVSAPRDGGVAGIPAEFEGRMNVLEDYVATSDEYIIEAARQAAEAVMEAYSRNGGPQVASTGADMAAIAALAGDLKSLEEMTRSGEERTARTFEALHETLVHIADKLERLEERPFEAAEAPRSFAQAFGRQDSDYHDERPVMPRATQPVFAIDEDPFGEVDLQAQYQSLKQDMHDMAAEDVDRFDADAETAFSESLEEYRRTEPVAAPAPAKKGLLSGLTQRFAGKRSDPTVVTARRSIEPTPSIDPVETLAPEVANQLLEPGSGVPDVKRILERVRAGQSGRGGIPADGEKADFIAAARRAAQLAVEEVDTIKKGAEPAAAQGSIGGAFARHRRPILMAVGAVLLAIMSYPLVNTLVRGENAPAATPVAAIEQSVTQDPQSPTPPQLAATPDTAAEQSGDSDVAPLSDLQPESAEDSALPSGQTTPDASGNAADPSAAATGQNHLLEPSAAPAEAGFAASAPNTAQPEGFAPAAKVQTPVAVPAEITPAALADAAKSGDPLALFEIGAVYTEGRGVKSDLVEAAKWYQLSADAGFAPAEYRLASLYEKGTGVTRDMAKAQSLYEDAANKGNVSAMHNLAVLLASGGDKQPDFAGAGKWFGKAADFGVRDSQFNLAILYARGNGVPQDLEQSYKWFAVAARDGDTDAAQKRDEVAKALKPDQLASAKAKFDAWKVMPVDAKTNDSMVPDSWLGKAPKTASVDMKKAVRNIQAILNNNGFDAGKPDGELGQKTVGAIKAFQKSIGEEPTGEITDALVRELLKRNS